MYINQMKNIYTSPVFWTILLTLLPLWVFLQPGLPFTHDGTIHVARIANFYQSLSEGNWMPRWAANLNWGYGSPVISFVYPLPSYIASLFHMIGFNFVDSTKLVFMLSYVFSALAMYAWINLKWGKAAGLTAAVLYSFVPYRFVDLYVRGALGEHVAFIFPPLICWALLRLRRFPRNYLSSIVAIAFGSAGLILSHNAFSVMFFPIVVLYSIHLFFFEGKDKWSFLTSCFISIFLGFALSAFFWVPAVIEQKYTLINIVIQGEFAGRFTPWSWFFYSPWNYGGGDSFTKSMGLLSWFVIAVAAWQSVRSRQRAFMWFVFGSLFVILVSLFLMTSASGVIWKEVLLMQKFQFPWRFLSVVTFVVAALGGALVYAFPKKITIIGILLASLIVFSIPQWKPKEYVMKSDAYFTDIYDSTTDSGEASPIWSVRFMEKRAAAPISVAAGEAKWEQVSRNTTRHVYRLDATTRSRIVENTLYFPGWNVFVDGEPVPIEFQDPEFRGLMTFWVDAGEHEIVIEFTDTKVRKFANMISLFSLSALLLLWLKRFLSH